MGLRTLTSHVRAVCREGQVPEEHGESHLRTALELEASDKVDHLAEHLQSLLRSHDVIARLFERCCVHLVP